MKSTQKGFIIPLLVAIIAVLAIGGGIYVYSQHQKIAEQQAELNTNATLNTDNSGPVPTLRNYDNSTTTITTSASTNTSVNGSANVNSNPPPPVADTDESIFNRVRFTLPSFNNPNITNSFNFSDEVNYDGRTIKIARPENGSAYTLNRFIIDMKSAKAVTEIRLNGGATAGMDYLVLVSDLGSVPKQIAYKMISAGYSVRVNSMNFADDVVTVNVTIVAPNGNGVAGPFETKNWKFSTKNNTIIQIQ